MNDSAMKMWKLGHQFFFFFIQMEIKFLCDFKKFHNRGNRTEARQSLKNASFMMQASSQAMKVAGSFQRRDYEEIIRPSMPEGFSGLGSMDHAMLVKVLSGLKKEKETLINLYGSDCMNFIQSLDEAYQAHIHVCGNFVGSRSSLHSSQKDTSATGILEDFRKKRLSLLRR